MKLNELNRKELFKKSGVYKLEAGGHIYVGSSKNLYDRLCEHKVDLAHRKHANDYLQKVYNKYGVNSMDCTIIEFCEPEQRFIREKYWIDYLNADMNLQDLITLKPTSKSTIEKISKAGLLAYKENRHKRPFEGEALDVFDYLGNYVTSYNNKEDFAKDLGTSIKAVTEALSGYKKGKTVYGYRARYKNSKVPIQKFSINPQYLGRYYDFYYIDDNGEEQFAFDSVKNVYNFFASQILKNKDKITIYPKLRKHCEEWKVLKKDNHIPSSLEIDEKDQRLDEVVLPGSAEDETSTSAVQ